MCSKTNSNHAQDRPSLFGRFGPRLLTGAAADDDDVDDVSKKEGICATYSCFVIDAMMSI